MEQALHISIKAEALFELFGLPVTNSILTTWIIMILLVAVSWFVKKQLSEVPSSVQVIVEDLIQGLYTLFESVLFDKTRKFFPLLATFFIFIIFANWIELLPGVGTIGLDKIINHHHQFIPLFRPPSADLNTTLALALVSVISLQHYGMKTLGVMAYLNRFITFKNPIQFFVGVLEIISEFAKIISFAFRLFGNIFAGEVLLTIAAFLMPLFAPLPFLALELFVGFIQALVFAMLSAVFLSVATQKVEH